MINMNDLWGKQKLTLGKQLYYETWENGNNPSPPHFPPLVKLGNNILKKKILKKMLR